MKLLITGASGFIGGHLVRAAVARYGRENVVALSSRPNDQCETIVYGEGLRIEDSALGELAGIRVLIHAGAFTPKSGQEANSVEGSEANRTFTEKLLALPFADLEKVIYLSSLDVYSPAERITESSPTEPATLYGQSKLDGETLINAFAEQNALISQILRIGHVYGPGEEKYAKFLPAAIRNICCLWPGKSATVTWRHRSKAGAC